MLGASIDCPNLGIAARNWLLDATAVLWSSRPPLHNLPAAVTPSVHQPQLFNATR